ncbi:hypothetical protein [Bailinhaonella thermotolerans]|uniref:Uncharacterized protein n=1 Tax=Bailinhaonella thermotolerans TaxID=1070861 RepID=A0A3A4AN29_9ACTN|nr:hypothetical protein [Bailinhaonella thermotolerans]RJL30401.1 hypothetical protein D5H75_22780 [Bailinhaonella thermotolerans]
MNRLTGRAVTIAAVALIALQTAAKAFIVSRAYFKEDDYEFLARAAENGLTWDYLGRSHLGQFMPGSFALVWVLARAAPYDWGLVTAVTLALHAAAGLAVYRMLAVVFGRRPLILVPLLVFLAAPVGLPVLTWWAGAINTVPLQIALPMAVAAHVTYLRTGNARHVAHALLWTVFGMVFFLKAAVIPVLLFALSLRRRHGPFRELAAHPRAWAAHGTVLAGYLVLYFTQQSTSEEIGGIPKLADAAGFVGNLIFRTFMTTVLGGPWGWFGGPDWGVASPPPLMVAVSAAVVAALVAITLVYRRRAWYAWTILLAYLLFVDVPPPLYGRVYLGGAFLGQDTRHVADALPVFALVLGLVLLPVLGEEDPYRRTPPAREIAYGAGSLLLGAFVVSSLVSINNYAERLGAPDREAFIAGARQALAKPLGQAVFDRKAPDFMLTPGYGEYNLVSRIVGPLATPAQREALYAPPAAPSGVVFDDRGRLVAADIEGEKLTPPGGADCRPEHGGKVEVTLPPAALGEEARLIRVGTLTKGATRARAEAGRRVLPMNVPDGLGQLYLSVGGDAVDLRVVKVGRLGFPCVSDVTVGRAVPKR